VAKLIEEVNTVKIPNETSGTYSVYRGKDYQNVRYIGITKRDPEIRFNEHYNSNSLRKGLLYTPINETGNYSEIRARILEQKLINYYMLQKDGGTLYNKINSISPSRWPLYGIR